MEMNPNLSDKARYDYDLIMRAQKGDNSAYSELLERYRDAIYFMLLKKVNNPIDAEDLTIEAFGKAFNNIHSYNSQYAFSTWLYRIAKNNCVDYIRRKKNSTYSLDPIGFEEGGQLPDQELKSTILDPEERFIKEEKAEMLQKVIRQLKPRYSMLIRLRYYQELNYEEISRELDIPLGTVKAQLFRSRKLLHAMIKPEVNNL